MLVFDKDNGLPLTVLDGHPITEMRATAGSAAAARKLATTDRVVVKYSPKLERSTAVLKLCLKGAR
ncbi:MAG: hypothetical protein GY896_19990 [Gammaproteobacteria bacterium]|nr:hypothetical protein [Gammaproteobacteria bacterium]